MSSKEGGALSGAPPCLQAALEMAARGWPVLWLASHSKKPMFGSHGVDDATTDPAVIREWAARWPDGNVGVACGAPGPLVLDVDDQAAGADTVTRCLELGAPAVATFRGPQFYFAGTKARTADLGYGELRGCGSYAVCPPSIHPSGKLYAWTAEPNGSLPALPDELIPKCSSAGAGTAPPVDHVSPGSMYEHLKDRAIRLVRAGMLDRGAIERALLAEFEAVRVLGASYNGSKRDTCRLAEWAVQSRIAERERAGTDAAGILTDKLGLAERGLRVTGARVFGRGPNARVEVLLSEGRPLVFEHFADIAKPGTLAAHLVTSTGVFETFKGADAGAVASAVYRLAEHHAQDEADGQVAEWGREYLRVTPTLDVLMDDQADRWRAFSALARCEPARDAGLDRSATALAAASLVLVAGDGVRLVRTGWFAAYVKREVGGLYSPTTLAGHMESVGWARPGGAGQVKATNPGDGRSLHWRFYVVRADW